MFTFRRLNVILSAPLCLSPSGKNTSNGRQMFKKVEPSPVTDFCQSEIVCLPDDTNGGQVTVRPAGSGYKKQNEKTKGHVS